MCSRLTVTLKLYSDRKLNWYHSSRNNRRISVLYLLRKFFFITYIWKFLQFCLGNRVYCSCYRYCKGNVYYGRYHPQGTRVLIEVLSLNSLVHYFQSNYIALIHISVEKGWKLIKFKLAPIFRVMAVKPESSMWIVLWLSIHSATVHVHVYNEYGAITRYFGRVCLGTHRATTFLN